MLTIYLAGYNEGEFDDYHETWLGAYPRKEDAEAFIEAEKVKDARLNSIAAKINDMFTSRFNEESPSFNYTNLPKIPQWPGKKGSKKLAPKEEVAAFDAKVAEARAISEKLYAEHGEVCAAYHQRALAAFKECMAEAGATQEEIDKQQSVYISSVDRDREYEIQELPFFGTPQDLLKAVTHTLTSPE